MAHHPQVGLRKQRLELQRVLLRAPIAHPDVTNCRLTTRNRCSTFARMLASIFSIWSMGASMGLFCSALRACLGVSRCAMSHPLWHPGAFAHADSPRQQTHLSPARALAVLQFSWRAPAQPDGEPASAGRPTRWRCGCARGCCTWWAPSYRGKTVVQMGFKEGFRQVRSVDPWLRRLAKRRCWVLAWRSQRLRHRWREWCW